MWSRFNDTGHVPCVQALPDVEGEMEGEGETRLHPERQLSDTDHHVTEQPSHVTDVACEITVADSALSEERDVLSDLPSAGSTTPQLGKGRRSRSETESKSSKVSLIPFKGRKRSHTLHEGGGAKEKEELEEVRDRVDPTLKPWSPSVWWLPRIGST